MPLDSFEDNYNSNFIGKMHWVNINGVYMNALDKKVSKNVINVKGSLIVDEDIICDATIYDDDIKYTKMILNYAKLKGIKTLYVQHPTKVNEYLEYLPYNKGDLAVNTDDYWLREISADNYNLLDLTNPQYKAKMFYKTDHHWTNESALNAAQAILKKLGLSDELCDSSNYDFDYYEDSLLGSAGIKIGEGYVGKDDFYIFYPKFDTDLVYSHYVNGEYTFGSQGEFKECFIDKSVVEDKEYNNKFNAFLYGGYAENIIHNNNINDGSRLLIISDSFARPMTQYLSLAFEETRYLDPQVGRYNDSLIEYIDEYRPDYVVVMYSLNYELGLLQTELKN